MVKTAEVFDPATQTFSPLENVNVLSRAFHSATVLTDGTLLIAGGYSTGGEIGNDIQIWDYRTGKALSYDAPLAIPRQGHTAALLPNGNVLISGGKDRFGNRADADEMFETEALRFVEYASPQSEQTSPPLNLAGSLPQDESSDATLDVLIGVRLTKAANISPISSQNVTLADSNGPISASVRGAEGGRLVFVTPREPLKPGTEYTLHYRTSRMQPD